MNIILFWLAGFMPLRVMYLKDEPFVEYYYVCQIFGYRFYLQRFLTSDWEKNFYNSPWKYGGKIILSGSFSEAYVTDLCPSAPLGVLYEVHTPKWFSPLPGSKFHKVGNAKRNTWALLWHSPCQLANEEAVRLSRGTDFAVEPVLKGWGFLEFDNRLLQFVPFRGMNIAIWHLHSVQSRYTDVRTPL